MGTEASAASDAVVAGPSLPPPPSIRTKALAVGTVWIVVLLYVAQTFLPPNVIKLPYQSELEATISSLAPQGWAFFTKAPREPHMSIYAVGPRDGDALSRLGPNGSAQSGWGLSRSFMLQQSAAVNAAADISAEEWHACDERSTTLAACVTTIAEGEPVAVPMNSERALPCGAYVFAMSEAIPFAWRGVSNERERALSAVHVELTC